MPSASSGDGAYPTEKDTKPNVLRIRSLPIVAGRFANAAKRSGP